MQIRLISRYFTLVNTLVWCMQCFGTIDHKLGIVDEVVTTTERIVRSANPRAPRVAQTVPPHEKICVSGTIVAPRDAVFRRLDVDLLVAKKQITQTDVIVTGTFFTGSIVSSGPISGSALTITGPASVQNLNVAGTINSTDIVGSNLTITHNTTLNNVHINHAVIDTLDVVDTLTVKDLYITGTEHIEFGVVDNLSIIGTTTTKNLVVTNHATINTLDVANTIVGNLSGASSLNVLKAGDTMTGQLRVSSALGAAAVLHGLGTTQTPALQLIQNPPASDLDSFLAIDSSGNVTQTVTPVQVGMLANATSGNVPNTLVKRDAAGSFEAQVINTLGLDVVGTSTFRSQMYLLFQNVSPNNILYVQKGAITAPNQFNSIKAAMDTITTSSANNPFVIRVTPGVYVEDTITMKPYTSIRGDTQGSTIIEASSPSNDLIVACDNTYLRNFTMRGATGAGKAAISIDGGHLVADMVRFESNDEFVKIRATSSPCSVILLNSEASDTAIFSTAFDIQSTAGLQCGLIARNIFWHPTTPMPAGLTIVKDSGPGAYFIGATLVLGTQLIAPTPGSGTKYLELSNGASFALGITLIRGFDVGISVPATLAGPTIVLQGVVGANNNTDISVQDQQTHGSIVGVFALDKVSVDPAVIGLSVLITEPTNGGVGMVGPISTGRDVDVMTNLSPAWNDGTNLGLISRGLIYTTTSSLVVTVSAGTGYLMQPTAGVDNLKELDWQTTTTILVPNTDNFLYINNAGQLQVSLADPAELYTIFMGKVRASGTGALFVEAIHDEADHTGTKLNDTFTESFGPIYIRGSSVSSNGLGLSASGGRYAYGTHFFDPVGANPLTWQAYLGAGTNEYLTTQTSVDYQQYDLSGTLTPIPFGYYAKHSLYVIGGVDTLSGTSNEAYALVYSQTVFSTLNAATVGPVPTEPVTWTGNIVPIAAIVVKNDVSGQIAEILDERPRPGFVSSSIAGVTVHGNLLGLSADDHPQYLLTNGGRVMTGNLQMGSNNITNVGTVNGVTVQSHASRHLPGSVLQDPLPMGVPVTIGTANSLSQSGGVVNNFAYSDHVHAHGAQTDATLHAVATTIAAGFMSSADKQALTNATPSNTPNTIVKRDAQGDFAAGTITAGLFGNVTGNLYGNVLGDVTGNVVGNLSGAASANVLKVGDTMTGQLRISDATLSALVLSKNTTAPTEVVTGNSTTQAPALQLLGNPTATNSSFFLTIDGSGNVMQSTATLGSLTTATSGNQAGTLVLRDAQGNFAAGAVTASLIGNVTGNLYGNVLGNVTGNVVGNLSGAASENVLKVGDTMTGQLRISDPTQSALVLNKNTTAPTGVITGNSTTQAPALQLLGNPTATNSSFFLTIDGSGNVMESSAAIGSLTSATSGNQAGTLVLRDAQGNFAADTITAGLFGNVTGNLYGNVLGNVTGNVVGNVSGAASANVLKIGDTMTGQLRISDPTLSALVLSNNTAAPTGVITGNGTTQAPALRLLGNPDLSILPKLVADATGYALAFDTTGYALTVDVTGNVMKSLGNNGDSFRTFFSQPNWYQPLDPRREVIFYDDFSGSLVDTTVGLAYADTQWKWVKTAGASAVTGPTAQPNAFGIVRLTSEAKINTATSIAKNVTTGVGTLYFGSGKFVAEMRVYVEQNTNGFSFRIGYGQVTWPLITNTDFSYGVYFEYTPATSANWICKTVNGGAPTSTASSVAVVPGSWYKLRIEVNESGTEAKYYINNAYQTSIAATIPTGTACGPVAQCATSVATSMSANIDYWYHQYVFTMPR